MDKFKKFLTILKKYHFWVTCVVVLLVAISCWWYATSSLASLFVQRKSALEGQFSSVQKIRRNDPNDKVIEAIHSQEKKLKEEVWNAWEILYSEQKEKNPFPSLLGEEFKQQFENLKPKEELPRKYREDYQNFIMKYLPKLLEIVDIRRPVEAQPAAQDDPSTKDTTKKDTPAAGATRKQPGAAGGRMLGMGPGSASDAVTEWTGLVDWNQNDIQALASRFEWKETPSTAAVVLAQEDLWVVGALLRVIARTNEGATGPASAAVKQIQSLQIGREAIAAKAGSDEPIFQSGAAGGGAGGALGGSPTGMMPSRGMSGPGMMGPGGISGMRGISGPGMFGSGRMSGPGALSGQGGNAGANTDQMLFENRYVGDKGMPLPSTAEYPYLEHPYAEFKMMPVYMNLMMDQRRLPKLLVECANSNMPIEVRRVRILKSQGSGGSTTAASGIRGLGGMSMGGSDTASVLSSQDVPVEIYGVIYIYNPPDRTKLGTGAASQEKPADGTAPPGDSGAVPAGTTTKPPATTGTPSRKQGGAA
jgi:hypothetical protein